MPIQEGLITQAKSNPEKIAIIYADKRLSYKEFNDRVNSLANALIDMGVKKGDTVAALLHNCPEYMEIFFACYKIGALAAGVNHRYLSEEIKYILDNCNSKTFIFGEEFSDRLNPIRPDLLIKNYIILGKEEKGVMGYEELIKRYPAEEPQVKVTDEDDAVIIYTGGTTGMPKGAVWKHKDALKLAGPFAMLKTGGGIPLSIFVLTPVYHMLGYMPSNILAISSGGTLVLTKSRSYNPKEVLETVEKEKVSLTMLAGNAMALPLLEPQNLKDYNRSSVIAFANGGAFLSADVKKRLFDCFPRLMLIIDAFGSTESPTVVNEISTRGSVSKGETGYFTSINPDMEVRVVDESGKDVKPGEVGEAIFKGRMMSRYYNLPAGEQSIRDGWLHTGDLVRLDKSGKIIFLGRKKECITSGGEKIYPQEVETALNTNPKIDKSAVIGVPDERWGESVLAVVQLKKKEHATEEEIIAYCKERIASYKKPKFVEFVDSIPIFLEAGKTLRGELKERYKNLAKERMTQC